MLPIMSMKGNDRAKGAHIFTYAPKSQEGKTTSPAQCTNKTQTQQLQIKANLKVVFNLFPFN